MGEKKTVEALAKQFQDQIERILTEKGRVERAHIPSSNEREVMEFRKLNREKSFDEARTAVQSQIEKIFQKAAAANSQATAGPPGQQQEVPHLQLPHIDAMRRYKMHGVSHVMPEVESQSPAGPRVGPPPPPTHGLRHHSVMSHPLSRWAEGDTPQSTVVQPRHSHNNNNNNPQQHHYEQMGPSMGHGGLPLPSIPFQQPTPPQRQRRGNGGARPQLSRHASMESLDRLSLGHASNNSHSPGLMSQFDAARFNSTSSGNLHQKTSGPPQMFSLGGQQHPPTASGRQSRNSVTSSVMSNRPLPALPHESPSPPLRTNGAGSVSMVNLSPKHIRLSPLDRSSSHLSLSIYGPRQEETFIDQPKTVSIGGGASPGPRLSRHHSTLNPGAGSHGSPGPSLSRHHSTLAPAGGLQQPTTDDRHSNTKGNSRMSRSQSHISGVKANSSKINGKQGRPSDPLNLGSVGSEHMDKFLQSVERVNKETEFRLSDEYHSHQQMSSDSCSSSGESMRRGATNLRRGRTISNRWHSMESLSSLKLTPSKSVHQHNNVNQLNGQSPDRNGFSSMVNLMGPGSRLLPPIITANEEPDLAPTDSATSHQQHSVPYLPQGISAASAAALAAITTPASGGGTSEEPSAVELRGHRKTLSTAGGFSYIGPPLPGYVPRKSHGSQHQQAGDLNRHSFHANGLGLPEAEEDEEADVSGEAVMKLLMPPSARMNDKRLSSGAGGMVVERRGSSGQLKQPLRKTESLPGDTMSIASGHTSCSCDSTQARPTSEGATGHATSRVKVEYLGSIPVDTKSTDLASLQIPMKSLYLKYVELKSMGHQHLPGTLEISQTGLKVNYIRELHKGVQEIFNPFPTIAVWAAVKFVHKKEHNSSGEITHKFAFLPLIADPDHGGKTELFNDLTEDDSKRIAGGQTHPAMFSAVMRKTGVPKQLECHGFVCDTPEEAILVAANLYQALLETMKRNKRPVSSSQGDSTRCAPTSDESEAQQPSRPPRRKKMRNETGSTMRRRKSVRSTKTEPTSVGGGGLDGEPASSGATRTRKSVRSVKRSGTMRRQQGNTVGSLRKRSSLRKTGSVKRRTITSGGAGDQKGKGDIYTKVAIPRSKSFMNVSGQYNLQDLFKELREKEGIESVDDILREVISSGGMSFNKIKPVYREMLMKLVMTMSKDEIFIRSQNIMNEQKKKELLSSKGKSWGVKFGTKGSKSSTGQTASVKTRKTGSLDAAMTEVQLNKVGAASVDLKRLSISNPPKEIKGLNKNNNKKRISKTDIGNPVPIAIPKKFAVSVEELLEGIDTAPASMEAEKNEKEKRHNKDPKSKKERLSLDDSYTSCSECGYQSLCGSACSCSISGTLERRKGSTGDKSDSSGCSSCECNECREQGDVCYSCSLYNESSNPGSIRSKISVVIESNNNGKGNKDPNKNKTAISASERLGGHEHKGQSTAKEVGLAGRGSKTGSTTGDHGMNELLTAPDSPLTAWRKNMLRTGGPGGTGFDDDLDDKLDSMAGMSSSALPRRPSSKKSTSASMGGPGGGMMTGSSLENNGSGVRKSVRRRSVQQQRSMRRNASRGEGDGHSSSSCSSSECPSLPRTQRTRYSRSASREASVSSRQPGGSVTSREGQSMISRQMAGKSHSASTSSVVNQTQPASTRSSTRPKLERPVSEGSLSDQPARQNNPDTIKSISQLSVDSLSDSASSISTTSGSELIRQSFSGTNMQSSLGYLP